MKKLVFLMMIIVSLFQLVPLQATESGLSKEDVIEILEYQQAQEKEEKMQNYTFALFIVIFVVVLYIIIRVSSFDEFVFRR